MEFRFESEMTEVAESWLIDQGLIVRREFGTPWGICDLVGVEFDDNRAELRKSLGQKKRIGPPRRVKLLHSIPDEEQGTSVTRTKLVRSFGSAFGQEPVEKDIDYLLASHFIAEIRRNHYQKRNGWMPLARRVVAVELKLHDVSSVITQAKSHRLYASESYIGLPSKVADFVMRSQRHHEIEHSGIGLLSLSNRGCQMYLPARTAEGDLSPVHRDHCVERFWTEFLETT